MIPEQTRAETVDLLQNLGLKEYEARCFLVLTQMSTATAKEISEVSEVPRTRVYDAVRVLEAEGLVEVQHSSPQRFRAVSIDEAAATLRQRYDSRIDTLQSSLERLDLRPPRDESDHVQEVWSLTSRKAVQSRTLDLLEQSDSEIVLVAIDEELLTETLFDRLRDAIDSGVSVIIGGKTEAVVSTVESELPRAEVFETGLDWLVGPEADTEVAISQLLLVDRTSLLVSSYYPVADHEEPTEQAIFATGLGNGIVVLIRRLMATGLLPTQDPGQ